MIEAHQLKLRMKKKRKIEVNQTKKKAKVQKIKAASKVDKLFAKFASKYVTKRHKSRR